MLSARTSSAGFAVLTCAAGPSVLAMARRGASRSLRTAADRARRNRACDALC